MESYDHVVIRARRLVLVAVALSLAVIGCDSSAVDSADESTTTTSPGNGPFVAEDPSHLIREARWTSRPGRGPTEIPRERDAALLDSSTPANLRIGVWGNRCYPHVYITVAQGPPEVELLLQIGGPIVEEGIVCPDLLATSEFELVLNQDIDLSQLTLTTTKPAGG